MSGQDIARWAEHQPHEVPPRPFVYWRMPLRDQVARVPTPSDGVPIAEEPPRVELPVAVAQPRNAVPLFARRYARWMDRRTSLAGLLAAFAVFVVVVAPTMFLVAWWRGSRRLARLR